MCHFLSSDYQSTIAKVFSRKKDYFIKTVGNIKDGTIIHTAWKVSKYGVFYGPYFPAFGLNILRISPYSVRIWENTDQKKLHYQLVLQAVQSFSKILEITTMMDKIFEPSIRFYVK